MYISAVRHSVYTCLLFQRYAIFLPLRACAHDVGDTGANTSTSEKTQEQISEIGELQGLSLRGARLQRKIRCSRQAEHLCMGKAKHFECRGSM